MESKKFKFIFGACFGVYIIIVSYMIFKKPEGWSMMPASCQNSWSPNYFLFFVLLALGITAAIIGFRVFSKKEKELKVNY